MKKLLIVLAVLCIGGLVYAAQTDTMDIAVTITGASKSVNITETAWNVSTVVSDQVTSSSMTLTNNSGGLTEDYQIKASTTLGNWTLGSSAGPSTAVLSAVVRAEGQGTGTFGAEDVLTFAYQDCTSTVLGQEATCGQGVTAGGVRSLLLRLDTPTSVSNDSETIVLTINVK